MVASLFSGMVYAVETPTFTVSTVNAHPGDENIDVTVRFDNNPGINSILLDFAFDADLKLTKLTYNTAIGGMSTPPYNLETGPFGLSWINFTGDYTNDFEFVTMTFKVSENATFGMKNVTLTCTDADNISGTGGAIAHAIVNGGINVVDCEHEWDEGVETTPADCTNPGVKTYTCKKDSKHTKTEPIAPLGHDEVPHAAQPVTCEAIGWDAYVTCSRCDYTTYVEIPMLGHDWDEGSVTTPADCEVPGEKTYTCRNDAQHKKTEPIEAPGHAWGEGVVTTPPTASAPGEKTYTCANNAQHTKTEPIPVLTDPTFSVSSVEALPGEEVDVTVRFDNNPGINSILLDFAFPSDLKLTKLTYNPAIGGMSTPPYDLETGPFGLSWINFTGDYTGDFEFVTMTFKVSETATLGMKNVTLTCTDADNISGTGGAIAHDILNGGIKVIDCEHEWDEGVETTPADCTNPGTMTFTCKKDAKHTKTEPIPALGHDEIPHDAKPVTCTEIGWDAYVTCSRCDYSTYVEIPATDHDWDEGTITTPASCTAPGEKTFTCKNDAQHTYTEPVDALNHAIVYTASGNVITEACTRGDYTETATISAENATYTGEELKTASVAYSENWKGGELEIVYTDNVNAGTAKASVTKDNATAEASFEIAKATEYTITLGNLEQSVADQDHSVTATIAPADATAEISIEYTKQGEENWTTTAPTEIPETGAVYKVRATLVSSANIVVNAQIVEEGTLNIVPHNWDEGTVTIPAECDKPGEMTYHCTDANCDATKTEPIPMLGHSFTNYVSDNNATCKDDGTETAKCDRCDVTDTRTVVDSHLSVAHTLAYAAEGAVITESCTVCTNHTETATISAENAAFTGEAIETAAVSYSAGWKGGELEIVYTDNVNAGTAKATVTKGEATAEITFAIAKAAAPQVVIPDSLTQLPNASDPVGQLPAADPTAVWETEYEVPLTQEEIDSGSFGQGVTTKWTTERPTAAGSYKVRTRLVSSDNYEVPVYTEQDPGWTEGDLTIRVAGGYYNTVPTNAEHQHNLSHVPAKEATEAAEGNIEYWYCASCDKYYTDADAKNETTKDKVILPKLGATEPEKVKFDDIKDTDWFNESVTYVAEKGLMTGTATTKFSPNANTTRAMLMTILARLAGVDTEGGANWYEKGLNWAKENGISDGTNPEANITREQLVTMLYRFAKSPAATGELKFADAANVSAWALDAMKWAVAHGIVTGMNANELNPTGLATRAQMAAILMRYAKLTGK